VDPNEVGDRPLSAVEFLYMVKTNLLSELLSIALDEGASPKSWTVEDIRRALSAAAAEKLRTFGPGYRGKRGRGLLHIAAAACDVELLQRLRGLADVNAVDDEEATALHYAAKFGCPQAAKLLIESGARCSRDWLGRLPIHYAWSAELVDILVSLAGADVNAEDKDGWTPLHTAASECRVDALKRLIGLGASVNARSAWGRTPLHAASCAEAAKALLAAGAEISREDDDGLTPFHYAARYGYVDVLKFYAKLVGPDFRNRRGETPLHTAAYYRQARAVYVLLKLGADPNAANARGQTPLHYAAKLHGDPGPYTPDPRIIFLLVRLGADPNARDDRGWTPLHYLLEHWDIKGRMHMSAKILLKYGADPNIQERLYGLTPLHMAAARGDEKMVKLLLKYGARTDIRDAKGRTPRDVAGAGRRLL
jgi:ankyrin repeat protein